MSSDLGVDDENHLWESGIRNYTDYYCLWDSVRNANSLITLFDPEHEVNMLNCLQDIADHTGWYPDAWVAGHSAQVQGGSSADILFCEAKLKGLKGIDYKKALQQMRKNNEVASPNPFLYGRFLEGYLENGYVSPDVRNFVSRHIEYTYQDWCIGKLAEELGQKDIARKYYKSSQKIWNLWRDDLKCFAPKAKDGSWAKPFNPAKPERRDYWNDPYFYEGVAYEWSLCALHVIYGLVEKHGGPDGFEKHLDDFFDKHLYMWKEIILHTPYLHHYIGKPHRSADRVRQMMEKYTSKRDGLPDNEDMGSQSAFYMCSAMGIYPIMGQDLYLLSTPLFRKTTIKLGNSGCQLIINCPDAGKGRHYIIKAFLNGKALDRAWIRHKEIAKGGILEFQLGRKPADWGTSNLPPAPDSNIVL